MPIAKTPPTLSASRSWKQRINMRAETSPAWRYLLISRSQTLPVSQTRLAAGGHPAKEGTEETSAIVRLVEISGLSSMPGGFWKTPPSLGHSEGLGPLQTLVRRPLGPSDTKYGT